MYSLLIKNATVIDGSSSPWYKADIAIKNNKIARIDRNIEYKAEKEIILDGEVVAPGFIDIHGHSDFALLVNGKAESKVRQGITTEVFGNCGISAAPLPEDKEEMVQELKERYDLELTWSNYQEYIQLLQEAAISINVVSLIGHGSLRQAVMGHKDREPTPDEMAKMKRILRECLEAGAAGFSSGLFYPPSAYASTEELIELAQVASRYNAIYTSHLRYEGKRLLEGVKEAIEIGRKGSIPVQISHHKVTDKESWGLTAESLKLIEDARQQGIDVSCDVYPYLAFSTSLCSLLPDWALEGGREDMVARIADKDSCQRIIEYLMAGEDRPDWEDIFISSVTLPEHKPFEGDSIANIAGQLNMNPERLVLKILRKEKNEVGRVGFGMCDEDLERVLKNRSSMIGSDGYALADYGVLRKGKPHPRNFGAFPRVLSKYVREKQLLTLEEAIFKMTGLPAWRLGLSNKGLIKEGMDSDLVIFDPETISDKSDYLNPYQYPVGIKLVIVNGEVVIENGESTEAYPGKVILSY